MSKVFLCYRRDDSGGYAGRVQDRLVRDLGADVLFMDVDNIPFGRNFVKALNDEVAKCEVLLAVIGRDWLDARDEHGNRRLDNPNDFVRIEIAAALQRDIPVVPILLEGAKIPNAGQLPKELEELSLRNGIDVRLASFHSDVDRLIRGLQKELNVAAPPTKAAPLRVQEERTKGVEAEIKSGVLPAFGAIGVDAAPTENKRPKPAKLAAVCAIGGFLAFWLSHFLNYLINPTSIDSQDVFNMAIFALCGYAAGILRSQFRILTTTVISTIARALIYYPIVWLLFSQHPTSQSILYNLCFFASIFVTIWLYEHLELRANRQTSVPRSLPH